jgi:hypothetical protein
MDFGDCADGTMRLADLPGSAMQAAVRSAMSLAGDDLGAAKSALLGMANSDSGLRQDIVEWAVGQLVDAGWRSGRGHRWVSKEFTPEEGAEPSARNGVETYVWPDGSKSYRHRIGSISMPLMEYEMRGGKRLGDCTKADIDQTVRTLEKQARTLKLRSEWLRAVSSQLPDRKKRVRDVLVEADLRRLQRRAMGNVAA